MQNLSPTYRIKLVKFRKFSCRGITVYEVTHKAAFTSYMHTVRSTLTAQHIDDDTFENTNKLMYWLK